MRSENTSKNIAYFKDGHTEVITRLIIPRDGYTIWFTTESGRSFVYEELPEHAGSPNPYYNLLEGKFDEDTNEVRYVHTDEIEKIMIYARESD